MFAVSIIQYTFTLSNKANDLKNTVMILSTQIQINAEFTNERNTTFIIDGKREIELNGKPITLVDSSLKGGNKGNYCNELNDLVSFLNEEKATQTK